MDHFNFCATGSLTHEAKDAFLSALVSDGLFFILILNISFRYLLFFLVIDQLRALVIS